MKPIKLSEEAITKILDDIKTTLGNTKFTGSKVTYTVDPGMGATDVPTKAVIKFNTVPYLKMLSLIDNCSDEVGWHCVVEREETKDDTLIFKVTDILVFPQVVTGATVTPDATKYAMWSDALSDDVFNKVRFHGHSHVRMGTSPSGVDTTYQDTLLQQVNDFYIFGIFNKQGNHTLVIYDVENNVIYEDKDITLLTTVDITDNWAKNMLEEHVTKHTYTQTKFNTGTNNFYKKVWDEKLHAWVYDFDKDDKEDATVISNKGLYGDSVDEDNYETVNHGLNYYWTVRKGTAYYNDFKDCWCTKGRGYMTDKPIKAKGELARLNSKQMKPKGGTEDARQK